MFNWFKKARVESVDDGAFPLYDPRIDEAIPESVKRVNALLRVKEQEKQKAKDEKIAAEKAIIEKRLSDFAPLYKLLHEYNDNLDKIEIYYIDGSQDYITIGGVCGQQWISIWLKGEEFAPARIEISNWDKDKGWIKNPNPITMEKLIEKLPDLVADILA